MGGLFRPCGGLLKTLRCRRTRRAALGPRPVTAHSHPQARVRHDRCTGRIFTSVSPPTKRLFATETTAADTWKRSRGTRRHKSRFSKRVSSLSPARCSALWHGAKIQTASSTVWYKLSNLLLLAAHCEQRRRQAPSSSGSSVLQQLRAAARAAAACNSSGLQQQRRQQQQRQQQQRRTAIWCKLANQA